MIAKPSSRWVLRHLRLISICLLVTILGCKDPSAINPFQPGAVYFGIGKIKGSGMNQMVLEVALDGQLQMKYMDLWQDEPLQKVWVHQDSLLIDEDSISIGQITYYQHPDSAAFSLKLSWANDSFEFPIYFHPLHLEQVPIDSLSSAVANYEWEHAKDPGFWFKMHFFASGKSVQVHQYPADPDTIYNLGKWELQRIGQGHLLVTGVVLSEVFQIIDIGTPQMRLKLLGNLFDEPFYVYPKALEAPDKNLAGCWEVVSEWEPFSPNCCFRGEPSKVCFDLENQTYSFTPDARYIKWPKNIEGSLASVFGGKLQLLNYEKTRNPCFPLVLSVSKDSLAIRCIQNDYLRSSDTIQFRRAVE